MGHNNFMNKDEHQENNFEHGRKIEHKACLKCPSIYICQFFVFILTSEIIFFNY
jgi:hypothetical protein